MYTNIKQPNTLFLVQDFYESLKLTPLSIYHQHTNI